MSIFCINLETYSKALDKPLCFIYGGEFEIIPSSNGKYLFDMFTYQIFLKDSVDFDNYYDFLEYPLISRKESMHAFVESLNNKTLNRKFANLSDGDFADLFWGTFDDGGLWLTRFEKFQNKYTLVKLMEWCDKNNIPYYIDKSDNFMKGLASQKI
ncbi:MAG: hypothetical protein K2J32_05045 [Ruminococcus sp.]|nr:hypothetical protein [Ruminococcus sp.]